MPDPLSWCLDRLDAIPSRVLVAVALAWLLQRLARRLGLWAYALLALPGTLAHELAHWLVALLLGAHPRLPRLWPERDGTQWRLGSVAVHPRWWSAGPIALAPLALLPAALGWMAGPASTAQGPALALHAWLAATLLGAGLPSPTDLRLAAPTLVVLVLALAGWWWLVG